MALVKCSNCGKDISDKARECIYCGETDFLKKKGEAFEAMVSEIKEETDNEKNKIIESNQILIKELEEEKNKIIESNQSLNIENEMLRQELENKKVDETSKIQKIEDEKKKIIESNQSLNVENESLRQELEVEKKKIEQLQEKVDNKRQEQINNVVNVAVTGTKKTVSTITTVIRYLIGCFWCIGGIACLNDIKVALACFFTGIPFFPFIYKMIFKDKDVSKKLSTTVQIIAPIVGFIIAITIVIVGSN